MKKSLIALADLAAVTAASAQSTVTVSGKMRYAFVTNSSNTAGTIIKATGIAITDGDVVFTSVEDLGGGMKASADMAFQIGGRSRAAGNRDGNLKLSGGFGTVAFGSIDAGNGIYGLGSSGAGFLIGLDNLVLLDSGNTDYFSYTTPTMSGFSASVMLVDDATATSGTNSLTGYSMDSTTALQDGVVYGAKYANGPLSVSVDSTQYGNNALAAGTARAVNRTRISANYNLGVAVVGAGYEARDAKTSSTASALTTKDTVISVNVPAGSYDFAAAYATSKTDGNTYTVTGYDLAARYNFSKRTYAALQYQSVKGVNLNVAYAAANEGKITRLQLSHSF